VDIEDFLLFLEDLKNLLYDTQQNEIIIEVLDLIDNKILELES
tara:strand:+ start:221 stop:349 length:129 start_codon:yes stop_codon:yes gene_type:complete